MRIERTKKIEPISVILETQEEIDLMYALFDFCPILDVLGIEDKKPWDTLRIELEKVKSDNFKKFFDKLDDRFE